MVGKLKALAVARANKPGMLNDGGGLYLSVSAAGTKSWIYRYLVERRDPTTGQPLRDPKTGKILGRSREMGLGSYTVVSLEQARDAAAEYRKLRRQGVDPIAAREASKTRNAVEAAKAITFSKCADAYLNTKAAGWRSAKHAQQWRASLATYAGPIIGDLPVQAVDIALVMQVLEPIWASKPETASRVRGRIEVVLDWAKVRGYRSGENPARWRGHLDKLLPALSDLRKKKPIKHHAALPFDKVPAFLAELQDGMAERALELVILTAARSKEILGARWDEFDLANAVWTVPAARMKAGEEHAVPLSTRALEILKSLPRDGERVFGNLSDKELWRALRRATSEAVTVHGFRSSFRDWAAERTNFPNHVVEMALAHGIPNPVEAAYRRGKLLPKRRPLMEAWARFCTTPTPEGAVIPLRAAE